MTLAKRMTIFFLSAIALTLLCLWVVSHAPDYDTHIAPTETGDEEIRDINYDVSDRQLRRQLKREAWKNKPKLILGPLTEEQKIDAGIIHKIELGEVEK